MSAIFTGIRRAALTLSTATPRPTYARAMNGKNHPHVIQVGRLPDLVRFGLEPLRRCPRYRHATSAPAKADAPYLSLISVGHGEPNRDASLSSRSAPWRDYPLGSS
jgi:hypothetical protein